MPLMHSRWPIFAALIAGVGAVMALWYGVLANPEGETVPASGGRYVEGVTVAPDRINPLFASANPTDRDLSELVFSGLIRLGPDGAPLPDLAERWEITGNGTTYVFYLRRGVAWHDGPDRRFDADDVLLTFDAITDPGFRGDPTLSSIFQDVVVTARDARTVEFKLPQPYAPFLSYLSVGILPAHLLEGLDADGLFNAPFNAQPVGTGPYRLAGRTERGAILQANTTYHFGPPRISTIEFRTFDDGGRLVEALRAGDVDGALFGPEAPVSDLKLLQDDSRFTSHALAGVSTNLIYFDVREPIFEDIAVRGALVQAINPRTLIDETAGGRGEPTDTTITDESWAYTEVEARGFNAGAAARALEIAGWSRGSDGVRRKDGVRLEFLLSTSNDPARVAIAENVARQWEAIDAAVTVQALDAATYVDEHLLGRQFQAALVEIDPGPDPDPYPFWHTSQLAAPGRNLTGYSDPLMDDVLERARLTTDLARRKELYEDFASFFIAGAPAVPLYAPVSVYVLRANVQGFAPAMLITPASRFSNVHEWYVRTRVR
jgi:peptide/nickel transport system substrate-binding protein